MASPAISLHLENALPSPSLPGPLASVSSSIHSQKDTRTAAGRFAGDQISFGFSDLPCHVSVNRPAVTRTTLFLALFIALVAVVAAFYRDFYVLKKFVAR